LVGAGRICHLCAHSCRWRLDALHKIPYSSEKDTKVTMIQHILHKSVHHGPQTDGLEQKQTELLQLLTKVEHLVIEIRDGLEQKQTEPLQPAVAAIEINDLCKTFGKNRAVDHLSLTVQQGEIFGLLGPNGSGKTTTINMISGLSVPTAGMVRVMGHDVQRQAMQVKRLLGCVPQETALFEDLSAEHNMRYHAALYQVPRREREERIAAMLSLVQLYEKRKELVKTFSGGMKRRLALARALLHEPKVLYLDEPSLGVDVQNRHVLYEFIRQLPSKDVTVLLTTNDMHEAEQLCTRVAIIDHGKLQVVDTPRNLIRQEHVDEMQVDIDLDSPDEELAHDIRQLAGIKQVLYRERHLTITTEQGQESVGDALRAIILSGRNIESISVQETELEEVFLRVTGQLLRD
jgi:ABC-2 type transport system ATP-binding protein